MSKRDGNQVLCLPATGIEREVRSFQAPELVRGTRVMQKCDTLPHRVTSFLPWIFFTRRNKIVTRHVLVVMSTGDHIVFPGVSLPSRSFDLLCLTARAALFYSFPSFPFRWLLLHARSKKGDRTLIKTARDAFFEQMDNPPKRNHGHLTPKLDAVPSPWS